MKRCNYYEKKCSLKITVSRNYFFKELAFLEKSLNIVCGLHFKDVLKTKKITFICLIAKTTQ